MYLNFGHKNKNLPVRLHTETKKTWRQIRNLEVFDRDGNVKERVTEVVQTVYLVNW